MAETWYVRKSGDGWVVFDRDGNTIAFPDAESDAHLIAAAPDLYAALERIVNMPVDEWARESEGFAEVALAKARGETMEAEHG